MGVGNYFSISGKWVGSPKNGPVSMPLKSHWHWSMCMGWILFIGEKCLCGVGACVCVVCRPCLLCIWCKVIQYEILPTRLYSAPLHSTLLYSELSLKHIHPPPSFQRFYFHSCLPSFIYPFLIFLFITEI